MPDDGNKDGNDNNAGSKANNNNKPTNPANNQPKPSPKPAGNSSNQSNKTPKDPKPLGYFNDDGQWVDLNPDVKLTDVFPNTHLTKGSDAAVNKGSYWLVQANDHRKNYGNDDCKFDSTSVGAFTPNSWGSFNYKYHVNSDGSLSGVGPVK